MSLIYEALRKSEEERRLGETPTLLGHEPASWRHAREEIERRRRMRWLLAPVLLVAIGAGWWLGTRTPAAPPVRDAARQGTERVHGEGAHALPSKDEVPTTADTPDALTPSPALEAATDSPALPRSADDVAAKDGVDPATLQRFEQGEQFANSAEQLKAVQPTRDVPIVPPEAQLPQPLPDPENAPSVAQVDAQIFAPPPPAPLADAPPPTVGATPVRAPVATLDELSNPPSASAQIEPPVEPAGVPSVHALPFDVRKGLPPLVLTMHVYAHDPARRFVLLDDVRMVEGANAEGLTLREIRADGVVLEYRGQAFFVPRSGQ